MSSAERQARDLLDRARQVLESIPAEEEWIQVGLGNIHANPVGSQPPRAKTWSTRIGHLVAESPTLIRDLAAELSRLRAQETRIRALAEHWTSNDPKDPRLPQALRQGGWTLFAALDTEDQS